MVVIEHPLPAALTADSEAQVLAQWNAVYDAYNEVASLILKSMTPELHRKFENSSPYDMIRELKSMFEKQARVERFDMIQTFHACKQEADISVGLILNGLTSNFAGFVRNYNTHNMGKTFGELRALLIGYEKGLPKKAATPQVMAIQGGRIQKANKKSQNAKGKGKGKGKVNDKSYIPKPKNPKPFVEEHPTNDDACHHCKEVGHWKRNCLVYMAELIMKKKQVGTASSSGIFTIELFSFPKNSWVYDTCCGTHICNTKQGLRGARKLKQGALYLYVGNGVRAQVEAIGSYDLVLPNGLVICLDNCHYAPTITRGVVSVSRLVDNGFIQCFTDYGISVSKNDVLYFNAISSNGIYEIDMINRVPNVNSIYIVSNKRAKHYLDSTYLWHCRLAHICKKRIEKLQHDVLLKSTDEESFDKCVSCLSSKITRKPFPHCTERDTQRKRWVTISTSHLKTKLLLQCMLNYWKKILSQEISGRAKELKEIQDEDTSPSENASEIPMEVEGFKPPQEDVVPIRRSARTHRAPDSLCLNVKVEEHSLGDLNEPPNYKAAILDTESGKWVDAMNAKMQSMKDNQVWCLVDLPPNCKTVGSKWLFKKKTDMDGNLHTYKARLAAKGFTQTYWVVYEEMFSPVADIRAIRILIAIVAFYDYEIWQMDVKTAFLNGYLDEDIYMVQPEGFVDLNHPRKVCKLQRSIYGLKQASKSWNKRFDEEIKRFGFTQNLDEPCVYQKNPGKPHLTAVKTILKYLRNTKDMFLVYGENPEAELRVIAIAMLDLKLIMEFISGLGIVPTINEPIKMFCDNSAALHFANEPEVQNGVRHYHRRYHYVRECIELGEIKLLKVHTYDNLADPFTKALSKGKLTQHARSMGLRLTSSFM
ncbi:retrotransposon protein, putative, ty1-copia subclass [Tanacetum coccineum]